LSIGMGVDANILIYERVKEEEENWVWLIQAIMIWYEKSWSAIKDGNLTTLMIALILFFIGTNVFKGFGTMMIINIWITLMILVPYTKELLLWFGTSQK
jgi:preprotein translocase subunit SecD